LKEKIRIASGQNFWGDLVDAPYHQVTKRDIDYLVMDYLAEVTMSMLTRGIGSLTTLAIKKGE